MAPRNTRSLRFAFSSFAVALLTCASFSNEASALTIPETPPSAWNEGSFGLQTTSEYFSSKANYDTNRGSFEDLPNGNSWTSFENRGKVRYAPTRNFSLFTGLGFTSSTAKDGFIEKTNSGLTEVFAGANFLLTRRWWRVVPEFEVSYPMEETEPGQSTPLTSDGVAYARAGIFLFKPYKYLRFESYLGFHFPGEGLAKRFMYSLQTEIALFGGFTVGGGVQGYETIISDDSSYLERRITSATANATSDRFWAYNPALIEGKAWLGLRLDKSFNVRLGYLKTVNGVRTAEGQSLLLSLNYNSSGNRTRSNAIVVEKPPVAPNNRSFKTEPEPNDPELFDQRDSLDNTERLLENR
jgi:hypothetical protein